MIQSFLLGCVCTHVVSCKGLSSRVTLRTREATSTLSPGSWSSVLLPDWNPHSEYLYNLSCYFGDLRALMSEQTVTKSQATCQCTAAPTETLLPVLPSRPGHHLGVWAAEAWPWPVGDMRSPQVPCSPSTLDGYCREQRWCPTSREAVSKAPCRACRVLHGGHMLITGHWTGHSSGFSCCSFLSLSHLG